MTNVAKLVELKKAADKDEFVMHEWRAKAHGSADAWTVVQADIAERMWWKSHGAYHAALNGDDA